MAAASTGSVARDQADPGPPWLTDGERGAWLAMAMVMTKLPAVLEAQLQRDAGLSFYEYTVLAVLSEEPERTMRMSDLAYQTSSSLSRLSHVASRLEKQGYLRRRRCLSGVGRATNATLTDAGYAGLAAAAPGHVRTVRELFIDVLTPCELSALISIGYRMQPRLDPHGTWPRPELRAGGNHDSGALECSPKNHEPAPPG